jgi:hypothetical protein
VRGIYDLTTIAVSTFCEHSAHMQRNRDLMYKNLSMAGMSVNVTARNVNCLFRRFCPSVQFEIIQNNVGLHINIKDD